MGDHYGDDPVVDALNEVYRNITDVETAQHKTNELLADILHELRRPDRVKELESVLELAIRQRDEQVRQVVELESAVSYWKNKVQGRKLKDNG